MPPLQRSIELGVAIKSAAAGGKIVSSYFAELGNGSANIQSKSVGDQNEGLITKADLESEQAIVAEIKKTFPDHAFLAEETFADSINSEHLWIIDPLDGTNNFSHGIPHFAVSVAYYRNGQPQVGAIFAPATNDWFTVEKGNGAWSNDELAQVNSNQSLDQTMLGVGFYYDRGEIMKATLSAMDELFQQDIHGFRRMGSAALDLVYVGIGRFGGFFEYTLSPWDFAAAQLFVSEAGGKVTTCQGEQLPIERSTILASNGLLHEQMLKIVQKHSPA